MAVPSRSPESEQATPRRCHLLGPADRGEDAAAETAERTCSPVERRDVRTGRDGGNERERRANGVVTGEPPTGAP